MTVIRRPEPEVSVRRDIRRRAVDLTLYISGEAHPCFGLPVIFKESEEGAEVVKPTISLSPESAENLMNELWTEGIRPSERYYSGPGDGVAISNHIASLQSEVAYLRSLVNHHLGIVS